MNSAPPPIRPQGFPKQQPPMVPSGSGNTLVLLSGIGLLVVFLIEFIRTVIEFVNLLDIASYFGGGFMMEVLLRGNAGYIALVFLGIGGFAMLSKKKIGWSFGFAAAGFGVVLLLYILGVSVYYGSALPFGATVIRLIALVLTSLLSIVIIIMLLLPDTRKSLQVGMNEIAIGAGMLGFLVIDFTICIFAFS